jgi:hypothetical protein
MAFLGPDNVGVGSQFLGFVPQLIPLFRHRRLMELQSEDKSIGLPR